MEVNNFRYEGIGLAQPNHIFTALGSFDDYDDLIDAAEQWCAENCAGTYFIDDWKILVNSEADAFAFRLRWC